MKKSLVLLILVISVIFGVKFKDPSTNVLTLYGNVEIRQVHLGFQVPGKIKRLFKEEGEAVETGEVLASLEDEDYRIALQQADANVTKTLSIYQEAQSKYERSKTLREQSFVSQQEFEDLEHAVQQAKASYDAAVLQKTLAENQLAYTQLKAPNTGILTTRVQEPGTVVSAGQIVYVLSLMQPIWVRTYVSEKDLGNVKLGLDTTVMLDNTIANTHLRKTYKGKISYISEVAEFTPKTVQTEDLRTSLIYKVKICIDNGDTYLHQGMPVTVQLDVCQKQ